MLDPERDRSVRWLLVASLALAAWATAVAGARAEPPAEKVLIGKLTGGPRAWAVQDRAVKDRKGRWGVGHWGITVEGAGMASSRQPAPVAIEFWHEGVVTESAWPYRSVDPVPGGLVGSVRIELPGKNVALVGRQNHCTG